MSFTLAEPENGCLLLADITGYTQYMAETELAHSQDVIADLLETIVASIEPTFHLSKLEGDAAFAYASSDSVSPSMVMDTIEAAYFAFQKRLRDVAHATSCPCQACVLIPSLDLKFFVHDGEYILRRIARSEELTGSDVILVHRLTKGSSGEKIGKKAFAVYTKQTLDSMAMDPTILGFVRHTENLEDAGEVDVFIQDLAVRWAFEQERNRVYVTSAESVHEVAFLTPAAPATVWDYVTNPTKRPQWQRHVDAVLTQTPGRQGVGTVNHCMHGPDATIEHIADWRPFSYVTMSYTVGDISDWVWTVALDPGDDGTTVALRLSSPGDDEWSQIGSAIRSQVDEMMGYLDDVLADAEAG